MQDFDAAGGKDALQEAQAVVHKIFKEYELSPPSRHIRKELVEIMTVYAKQCGIDQLPKHDF